MTRLTPQNMVSGVANLLKSSRKDLDDSDTESFDEHDPILPRKHSNTPKYDKRVHLTVDAWSHVFLFLEKEDVLELSLTCHDMREAAGTYSLFIFTFSTVHDTVWQQILSSDLEQYFIQSCHFSEHSKSLTCPISLSSASPTRSKQSLHQHYIQLHQDFNHYLQKRRPKMNRVDRVLLFREFCERIAPVNVLIYLCVTVLCLCIFFILVGLYMENIIPDSIG